MKNSHSVQKGLFRRLMNYINTKRYEKKKIETEVYKKNWSDIKWRYRIGKLIFLVGFYSAGNLFFVNRVVDKKQIKSEIMAEKEKIRLDLENGLYQEEINYDDFITKIKNVNSTILNFESIDKISKEILEKESKVKLIYVVLNDLKTELEPNLDLNSFLKILKISKKYDTKNLTEELADVIDIAETSYNYFNTGLFVKNKFYIFTTNLVDEVNSLEELAYVLASTLYDSLNYRSNNIKISNEISKFIDSVIGINEKYDNLSIKEELSYLRKDLLAIKNYNTVYINLF